MYQGEVLGSHEDGGKLQASLHKQYGDLPVLIVQVTDTPEKLFDDAAAARLRRQK
jgi:hypothetical protein